MFNTISREMCIKNTISYVEDYKIINKKNDKRVITVDTVAIKKGNEDIVNKVKMTAYQN